MCIFCKLVEMICHEHLTLPKWPRVFFCNCSQGIPMYRKVCSIQDNITYWTHWGHWKHTSNVLLNHMVHLNADEFQIYARSVRADLCEPTSLFIHMVIQMLFSVVQIVHSCVVWRLIGLNLSIFKYSFCTDTVCIASYI